ncbi:hypothetical protein A0256_00365 [Mucilaginibacter sp. PAMC 26640]|nr:hypothetical protein A0256_00365 [Mucilaginibacter sp. PAMC 26640]
MLRSEIIELEKSVAAILTESSITDETSYQKLITGQVAYIKILCADLKKKWTHELLSSAKEQVIKRYVQYHQAGIIQLSDMVSRHVQASLLSEDLRTALTDAYGQVNAAMENVLEFLRSQFYQYFDVDHKATVYHCQLLAVDIKTFQSDLQSNYNKATDKSLVEVVEVSVDEVIAEGSFSGISYRQIEQALNLTRMTHQLLLFGAATTTERLTRALYQQNFNSFHFYNWFQEHVLTKIEQFGQQEKQTYVDGLIRELSGIFVSPEKALQPELPSTDIFILPWLQEQTGNKAKRTKPTTVKFPLNLSVPQFALFIRIFSKTGCFPVENVAMITRFFTEHFTTKKQQHISHKSFGRAFYSLDQSAAAVVRDFLQKMLNYLNKNYFP